MKATTSRSIRRLAVGTLLVSGLVRPVLAKSPAPSFEDRVRAESVIQRVYYAHQIDAPLPFDEVFTRAVLEDRVRTYLRKSVALETLWDTRVTRGMLRAELRRMWRGSRMPERLQEIAAALDNDPALLLECLARPVLVDRLARSFFALDTSLHSESSRAAEALRQQLIDGRIDPLADRVGRRVIDLARDDEGYDAWLTRAGVRDRRIGPVVEGRERYTISVVLERRGDGMTVAVFTVEKRTWDDWWAETSRSLGTEPPPAFGDGLDGPAQHDLLEASSAVSGCAADTWNNGSLDDAPDAREGHTAVWTGSLLLVWGGMNSGIRSQRGARYDPATDTWSPMAMAGGPTPRNEHVAVWTGRVMIVWGGSDGMGRPVTGGRYDPVTDTWSATSVVDAPPSLYWPTAMWTGKVMLVWGYRGGGRYDPAADSWTSLSTIGSPPPIRAQKAVWTGSAMLIWGGLDCTSICAPVNRGWAYDPVADAWSTLSTLFAPEARLEHSMVWTGQEMIVWGGHPNTYVGVDTGGCYDPSTDRWTPMSTANAPSPRYGHTAVWTGSDMVVWGSEGAFNTGGRYNPVLDRWTPTSLSGAPSGRKHHSATWSGQRMIVWGGTGPNGGQYASGGRYDPVGDTWTPTSLGGAPAGRMRHSSVWTGNLLIVWGGSSPDAAALDTGGRYDPVTDAWTPTSIPSLPSARASHTAVWTGQEMVAWGGDDGLGDLSNGRRYDPATDTWRGMSDLNTPSARSLHTAVWTGRDMIVWGGYPSVNTGGRYDPATDSWSPTFLAGAPSARRSHSAVWTGSLMVIWGGQNGNTLLNTGGRYDPTTNTWTPTSTTGPPIARASHGAVWSGQSMIIWGGLTNTGFCGCDRATNTGAIYNPIANTWSSMSTANAPSSRENPGVVWTGEVLIVWGGDRIIPGSSGIVSTGGRYHPPSDSWATVFSIDEPAPRTLHTAIGMGDVMAIWGGSNLANGGQYCPGAVPVYYRDVDGDGHGDASAAYATFSQPPGYVANGDDCNDGDSTWWSTPSEVRDLALTDSATLQWSSPSQPGGQIVYYDALSTLDAADFMVGAACVVSDVTTLTASDTGVPPVGRTLFYLIRAENRCPQGQGPIGNASDGTPRTGRTCP